MIKKVVLSGIKPTGNLTLGNYIGAINNWVKMQEEYECNYMLADLHSLTVRNNSEELKKASLDVLAYYISCGLDPEKNNIFMQSHVHEHAELAWVLNCYTYVGELSRMTQFKDKSVKNADNINSGLFTYPVLMAADILLYQAHAVPVGEDQKQHVEIARDIAERFNKAYGITFTIPQPLINTTGARIMGLQNPEGKMGKTEENPNDAIYLKDTPDEIMKKFKKAVTDSDGIIKYSDDKPGIKNLITIYSTLKNVKIEDVEKEFENKGYGIFKQAVGEIVVDTLKPIQEKYKEIMDDPEYLKNIYTRGAQKASIVASRTLQEVYEKVGLVV